MSLQLPIKDTVGRRILRDYAIILDENAFPKDRPFYFVLIPHFCEPTSVIDLTVFYDHELVQLRRIFERGIQELFHGATGSDGFDRDEISGIIEKLSGRWPEIHPVSQGNTSAMYGRRVPFAQHYQPERLSAWLIIGVILGGESRSELWRRGGELGSMIFEPSPADPLVAEARKRLLELAKDLLDPKATLDARMPEAARKRVIGRFIIKPPVDRGATELPGWTNPSTPTVVSSVEWNDEAEDDATLVGTPLIMPPTA